MGIKSVHSAQLPKKIEEYDLVVLGSGTGTHLDGNQLRLEPGQSVIPHGPDRNLSVSEAPPRHDQP